MVNVAVDGGAFLFFRFMKLHFQGVFIMSKRSVLVGLVLVALCAFLVLPVWAVEPTADIVSGDMVFDYNACVFPDVQVSGFDNSELNILYSNYPFDPAPLFGGPGAPPDLWNTQTGTVTLTYPGNRTYYIYTHYTFPEVAQNFDGTCNFALHFDVPRVFLFGGDIYGYYYADHTKRATWDSQGSTLVFWANSSVDISLFDSDRKLLVTKTLPFKPGSGTGINVDDERLLSVSIPVSGNVAGIQLEFKVVIPEATYSNSYKCTTGFNLTSSYNFPLSLYRYYNFDADYLTQSRSYFITTDAHFVKNESFLLSSPAYSLVPSSGGGTGGDSPDYTSLLNMIISKLDLIIQNMANSGSTDLSGVETRLDTIIQNLGEVSPMADFEDSYIQNFGGQLEGVESSLSGKDNSLPSGGDMTGFTGALQSSLGIDSAGFSQADFDSAVSSLGGDKIDEGMPWYFFTQAVADSMLTPPSGVSVHSDVSPSDTWVSDSERWRRLWSTPY